MKFFFEPMYAQMVRELRVQPTTAGLWSDANDRYERARFAISGDACRRFAKEGVVGVFFALMAGRTDSQNSDRRLLEISERRHTSAAYLIETRLCFRIEADMTLWHSTTIVANS